MKVLIPNDLVTRRAEKRSQGSIKGFGKKEREGRFELKIKENGKEEGRGIKKDSANNANGLTARTIELLRARRGEDSTHNTYLALPRIYVLST